MKRYRQAAALLPDLEKQSGLGIMEKPFTRKDLTENRAERFHNGRWANADLLRFHSGGTAWVVKDFSPCRWIVKNTYGRVIVGRELKILERLQGIPGIPRQPFRLDAHAVCYVFIPGRTLKEARKKIAIGRDYFLALEKLVREMHARSVVHLDIRYMRNILIADDGSPALLDFQTSLFLDKIPRRIQQQFKLVDISGVYKCWQKIDPGSLDKERRELLKDVEKWRSLWILKGYPLGTRLSRR